MTAQTTTDLLYQFLNLEDGFDAPLLERLLETAEGHVANLIGATELPDPLPPTITQAILMVAAFWYENREAATVGGSPYVVPFGVHELLQPYRKWVV
jgi:hypothetical protein